MMEHSQLQKAETEQIGMYAGLLSLTEISVGGLLHAFHIPFSGQFLSLNQIFLLSSASSLNQNHTSRLSPTAISLVAATFKSLTPIGKKITPMIAIFMQGLLFNVGILFFGHTSIGRVIGAVLSSMWAFIQSFFIYYILFGKNLFMVLLKLMEGIESVFGLSQELLIYIFATGVLFKVIISAALALIAEKMPFTWFANYTQQLASRKIISFSSKKQLSQKRNVAWDACKDLLAPVFLISVILTGCFSLWMHDSLSIILWNFLRPIAIGFLFFFSIRLMPAESLFHWLEKKNCHKICAAFRVASKYVQGSYNIV